MKLEDFTIISGMMEKLLMNFRIRFIGQC